MYDCFERITTEITWEEQVSDLWYVQCIDYHSTMYVHIVTSENQLIFSTLIVLKKYSLCRFIST
jgi:hypothetical protein